MWTDAFSELADLGRVVRRPVVLDGERSCWVTTAGPSFERLSRRLRTPPAMPPRGVSCHLRRVRCARPRRQGGDRASLSERRALLETLSLDGTPAATTKVVNNGAALFAATGALGVEGIVAKRRSARYVCGPRRTRAWLKIKHRSSTWMDVAGWRPPTRSQPAGAICWPATVGALAAPFRASPGTNAKSSTDSSSGTARPPGRWFGCRPARRCGSTTPSARPRGLLREAVARELRPQRLTSAASLRHDARPLASVSARQ